MHNFKKRFSIAHTETNMGGEKSNMFLSMMENTSQSTIDEISDIYFGGLFQTIYNGKHISWGNAMGAVASEQHIDNLFEMQNKFGVEISLTLNQVEIPQSLLLHYDVQMELVKYIKTFYDRGLRSCTIASVHIMKSRLLHRHFPEMRWKNTVNHRVDTAQGVIDYAYAGYDTILIDRSLGRNLPELKKIKKAVEYFNKKHSDRKQLKTSLLVTEGCIYNCPFKKEHDEWGATSKLDYFGSLSRMSCDNWRSRDFGMLPRNGIDTIFNSKEIFDEFFNNVDILKFSGRLATMEHRQEDIDRLQIKFMWNYNHTITKDNYFYQHPNPENELYLTSETFEEIYNNGALPFSNWRFQYSYGSFKNTKNYVDSYDEYKNKFLNNEIWLSEKGIKLGNVLSKCRAQCWDCHLCEDTFESMHIDSALEY